MNTETTTTGTQHRSPVVHIATSAGTSYLTGTENHVRACGVNTSGTSIQYLVNVAVRPVTEVTCKRCMKIGA